MDFLKIFFKNNSASNKRVLPKVETLKVVVVEFVEYGNYNFGQGLVRLLQKNSYFDVKYFTEPFDKNFLSLQGRHFFDLFDAGNKILQKLNADVVIWGYQEEANIRLNFQTANAYSDWDNVTCSILDSLYIPAEQFEHINFFPESLLNLIIGGIAVSISNQRIDLRHLKQKLLKNVITEFSTTGPQSDNKYMLSSCSMNIIGLVYLSYSEKEFASKNFTMVKELFQNAFLYKNQIMQNVHLGCIYKNLGQLYETALKNTITEGNTWVMYKEAISNYRLAQRHIDHYNYPYDYALISFKLAQLYFMYWNFIRDIDNLRIENLRIAIKYLKEAENTYTQVSFPELWSNIEGYLGRYLSLFGLHSKNNEISKYAIKSYKNQQSVYRKELYPVMWARIQENIANVYYNMGKLSKDKISLTEAVNYYESALKVYENKKMQKEITNVNNSIERVMRTFRSR
ncbi:MAG: tetratricopeptide repeat protein [Alphaproteobacteria bacterium]|nr:tetratricopeptide repeat protein [Alphaproteobacteria bacterium]